MGESMRSTVKKAARLAVYDEIIIRVKNHHMPATIRVERALKDTTRTLVEFNCSIGGGDLTWAESHSPAA